MPFEPGQSGNAEKVFTAANQPANRGRKKGSRNATTLLREMMSKLAPDSIVDLRFVKEFCAGKKRITLADAQAARIIFEALVKGEAWAVKELLDRTEGKPTRPVEHNGSADLVLVAGFDPRQWDAAATPLYGELLPVDSSRSRSELPA
jgi:hypothetical protein